MFNKNITLKTRLSQSHFRSVTSLQANERNFKTDLMNAFMDCELP